MVRWRCTNFLEKDTYSQIPPQVPENPNLPWLWMIFFSVLQIWFRTERTPKNISCVRNDSPPPEVWISLCHHGASVCFPAFFGAECGHVTTFGPMGCKLERGCPDSGMEAVLLVLSVPLPPPCWLGKGENSRPGAGGTALLSLPSLKTYGSHSLSVMITLAVLIIKFSPPLSYQREWVKQMNSVRSLSL